MATDVNFARLVVSMEDLVRAVQEMSLTLTLTLAPTYSSRDVQVSTQHHCQHAPQPPFQPQPRYSSSTSLMRAWSYAHIWVLCILHDHMPDTAPLPPPSATLPYTQHPLCPPVTTKHLALTLTLSLTLTLILNPNPVRAVIIRRVASSSSEPLL